MDTSVHERVGRLDNRALAWRVVSDFDRPVWTARRPATRRWRGCPTYL